MKFKQTLLIGLGVILFASGNIFNLYLSSNMLWGEMEAWLFASQTGVKKLDIECPLMIAPWETATIRAVVTNTLADQGTKPQVNAFVSHGKDMRVVSQTLKLEALESQSLQWMVDASDIVFERLILVNILQRQYRDLTSRQGACSILVYSLFGLDGRTTVVLLVTIGVLASLLGAGILFLLLRPFTDRTKSLMQLNGVFLCLILLGLFAALSRRWGLTLILDAAALLAITTGSVEILFNRRK